MFSATELPTSPEGEGALSRIRTKTDKGREGIKLLISADVLYASTIMVSVAVTKLGRTSLVGSLILVQPGAK